MVGLGIQPSAIVDDVDNLSVIVDDDDWEVSVLESKVVCELNVVVVFDVVDFTVEIVVVDVIIFVVVSMSVVTEKVGEEDGKESLNKNIKNLTSYYILYFVSSFT